MTKVTIFIGNENNTIIVKPVYERHVWDFIILGCYRQVAVLQRFNSERNYGVANYI